MTPQVAIRKWLKTTTPSEARDTAKAAGTSIRYLRHVAAGRRNMSADLAQRLSHSSGIDQRFLCPACARCPLVK